MPICVVNGCSNPGTYTFPENPELRKLWEKTVQKKKFKATRFSTLCRSHFKETDFVMEVSKQTNLPTRTNFLKEGVVPSVFSWSNEEAGPPKKLYKTICRFCLKMVNNAIKLSEPLSPIVETSLYDVMRDVVPEIDLGLTSDPSICRICRHKLGQAYHFRRACRQHERTLEARVAARGRLAIAELLEPEPGAAPDAPEPKREERRDELAKLRGLMNPRQVEIDRMRILQRAISRKIKRKHGVHLTDEEVRVEYVKSGGSRPEPKRLRTIFNEHGYCRRTKPVERAPDELKLLDDLINYLPDIEETDDVPDYVFVQPIDEPPPDHLEHNYAKSD